MTYFLTFGLTLRGCVRLCSVIGIFASSFYVTAGVTLIMRAIQEEESSEYSKPLYLYLTVQERNQAKYERMKFAVLCSLGSLLIVVNVMQIISDTLLFQLSLKGCHGKSLWIIFIADILLWIATLICFVNIFPAGGLLLLTVVLVGTSIRSYILYIIHCYFTQLRKASDSNPDFKHHLAIISSTLRHGVAVGVGGPATNNTNNNNNNSANTNNNTQGNSIDMEGQQMDQMDKKSMSMAGNPFIIMADATNQSQNLSPNPNTNSNSNQAGLTLKSEII